jgi:hypothetical protein
LNPFHRDIDDIKLDKHICPGSYIGFMNDGGINAVEIHAGKLRLDLAASVLG